MSHSTQWPSQLLLRVLIARVKVYTRNPMGPTRPTLTIVTEDLEKEEEIIAKCRIGRLVRHPEQQQQ